MLGHYPSWLSNGSPWPPPAAGISLGGQHEGGTRGYRKMGGVDEAQDRPCWTGALI